MTVEDGIIMRGQRILVPKSMKPCVFLTGIDRDIQELVDKYSVCLEYSKSQQREPLISHDLSSRPWQYVGTDLFKFQGHTYLLVADYYSKMMFVRVLTSETTVAVVSKLNTIFN